MKTGLVVLLAGILATAITSIPVSHEEIGTGYPTVYDKHGFPFPWLTYVTGGIVCGQGFDCPVGPRPVFTWVFLVFDTILYVAIASATLTIFRTGLLGQPQLFSGIGPKKPGRASGSELSLLAGSRHRIVNLGPCQRSRNSWLRFWERQGPTVTSMALTNMFESTTLST